MHTLFRLVLNVVDEHQIKRRLSAVLCCWRNLALLILCFRVGVILRRISALPLAYADHERWCFSDSWDHTAWRYIQGTRAKSLLLSRLPGVFTWGLTESLCVQGNQMTLVYMEREYSSPEDPHVGIVHLVEVKNLVPNSKKKKSLQNNSANAQLFQFKFSLSHCRRVSGTLRRGTQCPVRSWWWCWWSWSPCRSERCTLSLPSLCRCALPCWRRPTTCPLVTMQAMLKFVSVQETI